MAHSIDPATGAVRGFVPARNDEERYLMRHIEDLADAAFSRGIARYSAFLSEALGEILLPADAPGTAYVFALEPAAKLICRELCQAGRTEVSTRLLEPEEIPAFPAPERQLLTATVSSLRLDAVLSAMLHVSRGTAAELIEAGRVEINHLPVEKPHAPVYEQDVFTVRGKGRFRLTALPGKSKKDRSIIEFFQY